MLYDILFVHKKRATNRQELLRKARDRYCKKKSDKKLLNIVAKRERF